MNDEQVIEGMHHKLDYEFVARLSALVTEFKERGLAAETIGAVMEHVSETHGVHDA